MKDLQVASNYLRYSSACLACLLLIMEDMVKIYLSQSIYVHFKIINKSLFSSLLILFDNSNAGILKKTSYFFRDKHHRSSLFYITNNPQT